MKEPFMLKSSPVSVKGFTIVELLIVIVVVAILATISTLAYSNIQQRAKNTAMISTVDSYLKLFKAYHAANGHLPYPPKRVPNGDWQTNSFCLNGKDQGFQRTGWASAWSGWHNTDVNPRPYACYSGGGSASYQGYTSPVVYESLGGFGNLPDARDIKLFGRDKSAGANAYVNILPIVPIYTYKGKGKVSEFTSVRNPELSYHEGAVDANGRKLSRMYITYALLGDITDCGIPEAQKYEKIGSSGVRTFEKDGLTGCVIFLDKYSNEQDLAFSQSP